MSTEENKKNTNALVVYQDHLGRTLIGEEVSQTIEVLVVKNPAIFDVSQDNQNLTLRLVPVFLREFLNKKDEGTVWTYKRVAVLQNTELDPQVVKQYQTLFADQGANVFQDEQPSRVVKLFPEE